MISDKALKEALITRALTVEELTEVGRRGYFLLIQSGITYNKKEKQLEFQSLMAVQNAIQLATLREEQGDSL